MSIKEYSESILFYMKKIFALAAIIILTGFGCGIKSPDPILQSDDPQYSTSTSVTSQTTTTTIMIPQDIEKYRTDMTRFAQTGGPDPLPSTVFAQKEISIPITEYKMRFAVEAAGNAVYKQGGGPAAIVVDDVQLKDGIAYVVLNIDTNGWAGVSVAQAIVHPVVAKTLGQFEGVKKVIFGQVKTTK